MELFEFGVRTVKSTAVPGTDYKHIDEKHKFGVSDDHIVVTVPIIDNEEWDPDSDFFVELYDLKTGKKFDGDDTQARVTIIDNDLPGTLGFEVTNLTVSKE